VALREVENGVEINAMSIGGDVEKGEKRSEVETFGAKSGKPPEAAQPG